MSPVRAGAALAILLTALVSAGGPVAADDRHHDGRTVAGAPGRDSIYSLRTELVDHAGRPVGLEVFRGHPVLIAMFYGTCRDACPLLIADLRRIERQVPAPVRADLRVLLVSLDPERDTPAALGALARSHHVDDTRWRFLTAHDDDTVRVIAAVLGVKYRRLADGHFNHSSVITLLDATGAVRSRLEGAGQPPDRLLERLRSDVPARR